MTEPRTETVELVTFWDITRRQFAKNRVAMWALYCVLGLVVMAAAAPLISMNMPYVMKTKDGLEWTIFERLFDRLIYPGGVDIFFNLALVIAPVWLLGGACIRAFGVGGETPNARRAKRLAVGLGILVLMYVVWASGKRSIFGRLLACALGGVGIQYLQARRAAPLLERYRRKVRNQTRLLLAGLFGVIFCLTIYAWEYSSEVIDYRAQIAQLEETGEGWAIRPPLFFHPDNIGEDSDFRAARSTKPPSFEHRNLLGTDNNSRDVLSRIIYGTRISLTIGIIAVSIYATIGIILGSLAGYFGGWVDLLIVGVLQVMICIPGLFLLLTIIAVFDTRSIFMIMVAIGVTGWPGITRLVRGEFFRQRAIDYVTAAKALGIPERRIIFGHILKNSVGPVLVSIAFGIAAAILAESFLSFLGLGDSNAPSWGQILQEGRAQKKNWLILSPGMAIFFVVTVLNLLGDGLRDALDPKLRH